ncbi:MAG: hypothetical protein J5365_04115 [Erysipelotrichaceae bacterium]|nr:hypothetical protein [Erysipelotrichaceae bacterium]
MDNKKKILAIVEYIIGFILVWNLLDFLYSTFIVKTAYHFSLSQDMLIPLGMMVIILSVQMFGKKK